MRPFTRYRPRDEHHDDYEIHEFIIDLKERSNHKESTGFQYYYHVADTITTFFKELFLKISEDDMQYVEDIIRNMFSDEEYYGNSDMDKKSFIANVFLRLLCKDEKRLNGIFDEMVYNSHLPNPNEFTMNTMFRCIPFMKEEDNQQRKEYFHEYFMITLVDVSELDKRLVTTILGALLDLNVQPGDGLLQEFKRLMFIIGKGNIDGIDEVLMNHIIKVYDKFNIRPRNGQMRSLKSQLCQKKISGD